MMNLRNLCAVIVIALLLGCAQAPDIPGLYHAQNGDAVVRLTLGEDGKGLWSTEDDDVPLTWEIKKGEVWLHTKSGGVLPGKIGDDGVIRLELPSVGNLEFRQVR
ncbi:hypothetical protein [Desulfovibrio ferrophilus]|uniref:Uncharacterized protein n=1 Tax=Desulfovibrio ferrophilus TaxID=241368 RepID=A0A2Z6AVV7_9BACT|nr:hypothetical protein [Desulfovibrio ferrophilus]BBD07350.1 uncharacterized protein DFE_0624 [Desulfovibrio ferrophilus]